MLNRPQRGEESQKFEAACRTLVRSPEFAVWRSWILAEQERLHRDYGATGDVLVRQRGASECIEDAMRITDESAEPRRPMTT